MVSACAAGPTPQSVTPADKRGVALLVRNDNWLHVNVYVLRGSSRQRLGMVTGKSRDILRIPPNLAAAGTLRLAVDPVGSSDTFTTDVIQVSGIRQIEFTVAEYLPMSRLMLR